MAGQLFNFSFPENNWPLCISVKKMMPLKEVLVASMQLPRHGAGDGSLAFLNI